jgi:hypothetical protein
MLHALNSVLIKGAQTAGAASARPDFAGHRLCDPEPYMQGLHDAAPFHPTSAGELAIALADEHELDHRVAPSQQPSLPAPAP